MFLLGFILKQQGSTTTNNEPGKNANFQAIAVSLSITSWHGWIAPPGNFLAGGARLINISARRKWIDRKIRLLFYQIMGKERSTEVWFSCHEHAVWEVYFCCFVAFSCVIFRGPVWRGQRKVSRCQNVTVCHYLNIGTVMFWRRLSKGSQNKVI